MIWATLSTVALAQSYSFPSSSADYGHFYPTTYVDHNGVDYTCGSDRYSNHEGTDFGAGSWSGMAAGRDVTAAASGVVEYVHDGERDDCSMDCTSPDNRVQIGHPDGRSTIYLHLKTWSIPVSVGDHVACGQKIGEMGSSGYSSAPHLHFGVYDNGVAIDPFEGSCGASQTSWMGQNGYQGVPDLECDPVTPGGNGGGGGGCFALHLSSALALLPPVWIRRRSRRTIDAAEGDSRSIA